MKLDLSSLKLSIDALENAIGSSQSLLKNPSLTSADFETLKAGVMQNFEVAYEQCWKMMKRWLEVQVSPTEADGVTRRELFRLAAENLLIENVELWVDFHQARILTSHTYRQHNADVSFQAALDFLPVAQDFFTRISARND